MQSTKSIECIEAMGGRAESDHRSAAGESWKTLTNTCPVWADDGPRKAEVERGGVRPSLSYPTSAARAQPHLNAASAPRRYPGSWRDPRTGQDGEMQITPVSNALGANVSDVALDELTDDQAAQLVGAVRVRRAVLRDQHLTRPAQGVRPSVRRHRHQPFLQRRRRTSRDRRGAQADQTANIEGGWHTDHSYDPAPAAAPSYAHGSAVEYDTCFIGMGAATARSARRCRTCWVAGHPFRCAHLRSKSPHRERRPTASATQC